jgi:predicted RNA binding protein YcfA (HicA-like mRNA interferase family)
VTPKLPAITARELIKIATKLGFVFDRQRGSHAVYYRERDRMRLVVPVHAGKTIKPKTLLGILDDMGVTVDEFRSLL